MDELKPRVSYSLEVVNAICHKIESSEKGLKEILQGDDMPSVSSFMRWLQDDSKPEVRELYARAKVMQMELLADQIIQIADDSSGDEIVTENGIIENREFVNRSRLRVDTRKWLMSKLAPKKYGDKLDLTTDGKSFIQNVIVNDSKTAEDINNIEG